MKPPSQISVPDSRDAITQEIKRLLRAAAANGRIPTPRDDILRCAQLVESGELDLDAYKESFGRRIAGFLHKAVGKVRGFLDYRTREVYVDPNIHPNKKNFVLFHEIVHKVLDWQRVIYTEDEDSTLSSQCRSKFEGEANYGAAEIIFQCERFEEEAHDFEPTVASVLHLANRFEASAHSTIRRFVERHHLPCAVLILKRTKLEHIDGYHSYVVCYSIASDAFLSQFGDPFVTRFLNPGDKVCNIMNSGAKDSLRLRDSNGGFHEFTVEPFDSSYALFALITPMVRRQSRVNALFQTTSKPLVEFN